MYVKIKTPFGDWQYVKYSEDGLVYGIYKNKALEGEELYLSANINSRNLNLNLRIKNEHLCNSVYT